MPRSNMRPSFPKSIPCCEFVCFQNVCRVILQGCKLWQCVSQFQFSTGWHFPLVRVGSTPAAFHFVQRFVLNFTRRIKSTTFVNFMAMANALANKRATKRRRAMCASWLSLSAVVKRFSKSFLSSFFTPAPWCSSSEITPASMYSPTIFKTARANAVFRPWQTEIWSVVFAVTPRQTFPRCTLCGRGAWLQWL